MTELRPALRHLRRHPRFAGVVVATLALGIGSVTALFSVADAVLWEPLPFAEPERLVRVWGDHRGDTRNNLNPLDAFDYRARVPSFESMAVLHLSKATVTGAGEPLALRVARVSADFFPTLGVEPALGRFFRSQEERRGSHQVVVLSHELWRRSFGGDPAVLGRSLALDGEAHTVVGVAPPGVRHFAWEDPRPSELWRPLAVDPERQGRGGHFVHAAARLRPGATVAQAQAELDAVVAQLAGAYPDLDPYWGGRVEPLHEAVAGPARRGVVLLLGAGVLVLLVACANVATLLLARAVARRGEIGVRVALGAGAGRLVRQLLAEAAALAVAGGVAGLLVAAALVAVFRGLASTRIPRLDLATLDGRALVTTLVVALATVAVFGLAPALRLARLGRATPDEARGAARRGHRLERFLVVAEVAVSLTPWSAPACCCAASPASWPSTWASPPTASSPSACP
jgi:putative ABC transport system permease protein